MDMYVNTMEHKVLYHGVVFPYITAPWYHRSVSVAHRAGLSPQLGNPRQLKSPESRLSASFSMRTGSRAATGRRVRRNRSTEAPVGRTAADLRRSPPEPNLLTSEPKT